MKLYTQIAISFLCLISLLSSQVVGQENYVLLPDVSGYNRSLYEEEVNEAADDLLDILSDIELDYDVNYSANFKFFDFGFYLHNNDMQGVEDILNRTITNIPNDYYVLFAKESNDDGIYSKIHIKVNLGENSCAGYSNENIESILEGIFDREFENNPARFTYAAAAVYDKLLCLMPEYWYSCLESNLISKEVKSIQEGEQCQICDVQILKDYKFLQIPIELTEVPDASASQGPTLSQSNKKNTQLNVDDRLNVNVNIPGIGEVDLASIINSNSFYSNADTYLTYSCDDFRDVLENGWNQSASITWIHIELEDNLTGTMYFGSSVDGSSINTDHALSHYFDFWNNLKEDQEQHFMAQAECSFYSDQFFDSSLGIDWLQYVTELLGCSDFKPYQKNGMDAGIVPLCFWEDAQVFPLYYTAADLPFGAGLIDGCYNEIEGLYMLVQGGLKFVNALVSYPGCWIIDQLPEAEFIGEIELRLMETYPNRYAELSMKFNELIDWFGYENCDQQKERLDKFYQTFSQIISFFSKNGLSGIIDQAFTALGTYFSGLAGFDNEERYKQGKLVFAIASIFVPAGAGAKVLDKLSDTLGKLTKKIDDFLRGKGDDAAKVLTDDFAEAMAYLKSLDDPALIAKMDEDLIIGSKEFLEFISEKGVDGVKSWKVLFDDDALRVVTGNLEKVDNHLAKGIHLEDEMEAAFKVAADKAKWVDDIGYNVLRKANNKAEYINPSNSLLKWTDQHPSSISQSIQSALNSPPSGGKFYEGKVADYMQQQGRNIDGFGLKVNNSTSGNIAGDIDVMDASNIIEVKKSYSSFSEGQVDKFVDTSLPNYLNPYGKNALLYIDEAMTATQKADVLSKIPSNVTLVNSLDELGQALQ